MKGVDQFDQNDSYYKFRHRFKIWWKSLFVYMIDIAIYNSYLIYKRINSKKDHLSRLQTGAS